MRAAIVGLVLGCTTTVRDAVRTWDTELVEEAEEPLEAESELELEVNRTDGLVWPDCSKAYGLTEFMKKAGAWCNPNLVAPEKRVPHKLQGLYWIKGSWTDDVAVCFSTGEWDATQRKLKLVVFKDFLFVNRLLTTSSVLSGKAMAWAAYTARWEYHITFKDDSLTAADWVPKAGGGTITNMGSKVTSLLLNWFTGYKVVQDDSVAPGERWTRPSNVGMWPISLSTGELNLWRVMDGGLTINQQWADLMFRYIYDAANGNGLIRYFDKRDQNVLGIPMTSGFANLLRSCPEDPALAPATLCMQTGVFVAVTKQPKFGVRHINPTTVGQAFARTSLGGDECTLEYQLKCNSDGEVQVEEVKRCTHAVNSVLIHSLSGRSGALRTTWQVCARPLYHSALNLTTELVDLTWDTPLGAQGKNMQIIGCVELWQPDKVTTLGGVRGDFEAQRAALVRRKAEVGGCPTYRNGDDRKARGGDFMQSQSFDVMGVADGGSSTESLGPWMVALQYANALKADNWHNEIARWSPKESWTGTLKGLVSDVATFGLMTGFFGISMSMNSTTASMAFAEVNCGAPAPFLEGPQKFRHAEVAAIAAHPAQRRTYATATVLQVEDCFDPTGALFQSSGSKAHGDWRKALDGIFSSKKFMAPVYPKDSNPHTWSPNKKPPSKGQIGSLVLPVLLENVWGEAPDEETMSQIVPYLDKGRMCNLGTIGATVASATFSKSKIIRAREAMARFAAGSSVGNAVKDRLLGGELEELRAKLNERVAAEQHRKRLEDGSQEVPERFQSDAQLLLQDLSDVVLFKGLLDTSEMVHKCVTYQWRDHEHRRLFLKDSAAYLHELMRYDGAVTSFTAAFDARTTMQMEGQEVVFPENVPVQYVVATANRDPAVFPAPEIFEPTRPELKEQLSWGGRLEDVKARNYVGAPRHCPAYQLSMDIATAVCAHLTHELDAYNGTRGKESRTGHVVVIKPDDKYDGAEGIVVHRVRDAFAGSTGILDSAYRLMIGTPVLFGSWCVVGTVGTEFMGCYRQTELKMGSNAILSITESTTDIEAEAERCPAWLPSYLEAFAEWAFDDNPVTKDDRALSAKRFKSFAFDVAFGNEFVGKFSRQWADTYTVGLYSSITRMVARYRPRTAGDVPVPKHMGLSATLRVGRLSAPTVDLDFPTFLPAEAFVPKHLYQTAGSNSLYFPTFNCLQDSLRSLVNEFAQEMNTGKKSSNWNNRGGLWDDLNTEDKNLWHPLLHNEQSGEMIHPRRKGWMEQLVKPGAKGSVWPVPANDLQYRYFKNGNWEDTLERALAFRLIGAHRVKVLELGTSVMGDESDAALKYVVDVSALEAISIRPGFGRPGCEMYFDAEGLPKVIKIDGQMVRPGDDTWQYSKFVWRSSLMMAVTIEDHVLLSHFRVANEVSVHARDTLPPNHPLRRLLSIFTFGSIFANLNQMHTLLGNNQLLHRASPFSEFNEVTEALNNWKQSLVDTYEVFFVPEKFEAMPQLLKEAPYFADGKLLFSSLKSFVGRFMQTFDRQFCMSGTGKVNRGDDVYQFAKRLDATVGPKGRRQLPQYKDTEMTCEDFGEALTAVLWTVTGFHRHVGDVADLLLDPDVASFSWKEGEAFPRPRQHVIASVMVPFITAEQPKLIPKGDKDYTYIFDEIEHDDLAKDLWRSLDAELKTISTEIARRNQARLRDGKLVYWNADPKQVEISIAV